MSNSRPGRRILALMACSAVLAVTTGCRRSPFQRLADAPPGAPTLPSSVAREAIPELAPVVAAATPTTATIPAAAPALPSRTMPTPTPAPAEPQPEATAEAPPIPTPMLDAALRRAEAAEDDRAKILRAIATAQPIPPEPASEPEVAPAPVPEPTPAPAPATTAEPTPEAPPVDAAVKTASVEVEVPVEATEPKKTPEPEQPPEPEKTPNRESAPVEPEAKPAEPEASLPTPIADEPPPLTIGAVQLCRKINGFGSFEPLNAKALRPGKSALVYSELVGLEYRPEGEGFASHVATRVELIRPGDGEKAWEVSGEAADRCRTKRRDSYVATLITLPDSIAPGPYTLRLYQADAANGQTASAEIPVTIAR